MVLATLAWRLQALNLVPQLPPMTVHVLLGRHPRVDVPSELVDQVAEGEEGYPLESHVEEYVDVGLLARHVHLLPDQAKPLEVLCSAVSKGEDVSNPLMEARVCSSSVEVGLFTVLEVVLDVTHLVVHSDEVFL